MWPWGALSSLGGRRPSERAEGAVNCGTCTIAPGIRSLNCAGPGTASKLIPGAPNGCVLRRCSRLFRISRRNGLVLELPRGSEGGSLGARSCGGAPHNCRLHRSQAWRSPVERRSFTFDTSRSTSSNVSGGPQGTATKG
eukprot:14476861-Alexandrium_andersonii.AAC.1